MALYAPPARNDDFHRRPDLQAAMERGWDAVIDAWLSEVAYTYSCDSGPSLFFDPRKVDTLGEPRLRPVTWDAFPRTIASWFRGERDADRKRWSAADTLRSRPNLRYRDDNGQPHGPAEVFYRQQDEYCEWYVERQAGRPHRMTFTSEGPEYWRYLAHGTQVFFPRADQRSELFAGDMTLVEELYREHVDDAVRAADLLWPYDVQLLVASDPVTGQQAWVPYARKGTYNALNPWNTLHGAMHLTHPSNTLNAEMQLAGGATVPRADDAGRPITGAHQLICATAYGDPNRASDPLIGKTVNDLARRGLSVSLADPVGLYIADMDESRFRGVQPEDVKGAWRVARGKAANRQILRAVYEPPTGRPVADQQVDGRPNEFGGQVADAVQLELVVMAQPLGTKVRPRGPIAGGCCRHPERLDIYTIPPEGKTCADIVWTRLAPTTAPDGAPAQPVAGGEHIPDPARDPRGRR
jgi:hypothetical protein